jgi:hypothetical protein
MASLPLRLYKTTMRVVIAEEGCVDYRLHILGIRIWREYAQLIARDGEPWKPIGPEYLLPISLPDKPDELKGSPSDVLRLTAWQYDQEHPGSDLRAALLQKVDFLSSSAD